MNEIHGEIFDGRKSRNFSATLRDKGNGELQVAWDEGKASYPLGSVKVSSRLGNSPRNLSLPGGWKFETKNNDAVDAILIRHKAHGWQGLVKRERRSGYLYASLLLLVLLLWTLWQYGMPMLAKVVAAQLPPDISETASARSLRYLDENIFGTSRLPDRLQKRLQKRFAVMTAAIEGPYQFELQFRRGREFLGANAVALPSGLVILTDELVALAANDDELVGVVAHEVAHVVKHHAMQQSLQHSLLRLIYAFTVGKPGNMENAVLRLLLHDGYSVVMEGEADDYAYEYLLVSGLSPKLFAEMMKRIAFAQQRQIIDSGEDSVALFEYFATHPTSEQRLKRFEKK